jgi:FkbM family methyltransferase
MSAIRKAVQRLAGALGYRIVPRERDAMTMLRVLRALPVRTVIDVGANNGRTCSEWLAVYPDAHVHAIEALDRYQPELAAIATAGAGRMTVWQYAASDEEREVVFLEHEDHPSSSSLLKSTELSHSLLPFTRREREVRVQAIPLALLFERNGIDPAPGIFLKLDVQGAEAKVLRGCGDLLGKTMAVLAEVNLTPLYQGQATLPEICAILEPAGLRFAGVLEQFHAPDHTPIYVDAVFLRRA